MSEHNQISVSRDANGNVMVSGDGNIIIVQQVKSQIDEPPESQTVSIGPNPYKGLSAFHEQDSDRFFGREELTGILWEKYRNLFESEAAARFMPILGPSGSGKSSVARAGLIPELARKPMPAMKKARVAVFVPGTKPIEALATILARIATNDDVPVSKTREFADEMKLKNSDGQFDGLRRIAHALPDIADSPLVILVDQFEEIYSLCDDAEERKIFIENLLHAAKDKLKRVFVVITLRSDFLTQTQIHAELSHIIALNSVIVPAMNEDELRRAIAKPAENAGHPIDTSTVDLLIEQSRDHEGVLPLLEFALTQIWNGMAENIEPAETIKKIGGVGGALAKEAGRLYDLLSDTEKRIAKRGFLALVRLGEGTKDTRRRVPMSDIVAYHETPDTVHKVLRKFSTAGSRLITLSDSVAEITHEALFEHWTELKQWLDKSRDDIRFERRLSEAAGNWNENGKAEGLLWWQSPNLELLKRFYQKNHSEMNAIQTGFYQASVSKANKAKWINRGIAAVLVILTLIAGAGSVLTYQFEIKANQEKDRGVKLKELGTKAINTLIYNFSDRLKNITQDYEIAFVEDSLQYNLELLKRLYGLNPDSSEAQREDAINVEQLSLNTGDGRSLSVGRQRYMETFDIKKIVVDNPANTQVQMDLSFSYNKLGNIHLKLGNTNAALNAYNQALEISKKFAADNIKSMHAQRFLSFNYNKLGDINLQLDKMDAALNAYQQFFEISKKLLADDPKNKQTQRDLSVSYNKLGDIHLKLGNNDAALNAYNQALEIRTKLAEDDQNDTNAQRDLWMSFYKFGTVYETMKKNREALECYEQAFVIAKRIVIQYNNHPEYALEDVKILKNLVEKMGGGHNRFEMWKPLLQKTN